jgi:predicted HTH transcriptional regulator
MSWKSNRKALKKAFDYAKENKTVSPKELAEKFGITKSESTVIIGYLTFGKFDEFMKLVKKDKCEKSFKNE